MSPAPSSKLPKSKSLRGYTIQVHGGEMPLHTLITGEYEGVRVFPSAYERQTRLIDIMIDVAIETNVLDMLEQGRKPASIMGSKFVRIPGKQGLAAQHALQENMPHLLIDDAPTVRHKKCMEALASLREKGYLVTSKTLCSPSRLKENREFINEFAKEWDEYTRSLKDWRDNPVAGEKRPTPPDTDDKRFSTQPVDMNLAVFNNLSSLVQLEEPGPKRRISAVDKLARSGGGLVIDGSDLNAASLKDMNRIKVSIATKARSEDFLNLLEARMSQEPVAGLDSNILIDTWKLQNSGFLDRKAAIAFPRESGQTALPAKGTIAEVMVTSPQLSVAHVITHYIYDLIREMEVCKRPDNPEYESIKREGELDVRKLFPAEGDSEAAGMAKIRARESLYENYEKAKKSFDRRAERLGVGLRFPKFERQQFNTAEGLKNVLDALIHFHREVYINLINASAVEWQEHYFEHAYLAEARLNKGVKDPPKGGGKSYLPTEMLEAIAPDMQEKKRQLREKAYLQVQCAEQSQARSR